MVTLTFGVQAESALRTSDINCEQSNYQINSETVENMTLAQTMQSISESVDWGKAVYAGVLFNKRTKADLEALIDSYAANGSWIDVLKWTVICRKLGIERESAIKAALDGLPMIGPLPWTINYGGSNYFCVEHKFALFGYYYAEKFNYRLDKWNKTNAYNFFKTVINNVGHPVLFIDARGNVWGSNPRYYDESASTVQCFLVFYELNIMDALNDALYWWKWINNNLWYQDTHYKYALYSADYECEAGFFAKIISNLKYHKEDVENWSRVLADMQNRFLIDKWDSKQWFSGVQNTTTYVVVHHYPSNQQRRLQNTIGAWTALLSLYKGLSSTSQSAMQDLLIGYSGLEPAWKLLMSPIASLYDNSTNKFRWESTSALSHEATAYALALMFLNGIVPQTTTLAFPIEEYTYEYIYDIDPELHNINLENKSIRVSVMSGGTLEFHYGTSPVCYNFSSSGVYEITFSADWNDIINLSKIQELPSNRKFLWNPAQFKHDIAVVNVTSSSYILKPNETSNIETTIVNDGNFDEIFNLTVYAGATIVDTIMNITLASRNSTKIVSVWNATGFEKGFYPIIADASPVLGEIDTENNTKIADNLVLVLNSGHDVAVKNITSKTVVGEGYSLIVNVTIVNVGSYTEAFNVTVSANSTHIASQDIILESGASTTINLAWNTTGFEKGNYTMSVSAEPVLEESDVTDNTLYEWIAISILGDVNGDFCV